MARLRLGKQLCPRTGMPEAALFQIIVGMRFAFPTYGPKYGDRGFDSGSLLLRRFCTSNPQRIKQSSPLFRPLHRTAMRDRPEIGGADELGVFLQCTGQALALTWLPRRAPLCQLTVGDH